MLNKPDSSVKRFCFAQNLIRTTKLETKTLKRIAGLAAAKMQQLCFSKNPLSENWILQAINNANFTAL